MSGVGEQRGRQDGYQQKTHKRYSTFRTASSKPDVDGNKQADGDDKGGAIATRITAYSDPVSTATLVDTAPNWVKAMATLAAPMNGKNMKAPLWL